MKKSTGGSDSSPESAKANGLMLKVMVMKVRLSADNTLGDTDGYFHRPGTSQQRIRVVPLTQ
jgi:hypothetical protein